MTDNIVHSTRWARSGHPPQGQKVQFYVYMTDGTGIDQPVALLGMMQDHDRLALVWDRRANDTIVAMSFDNEGPNMAGTFTMDQWEEAIAREALGRGWIKDRTSGRGVVDFARFDHETVLRMVQMCAFGEVYLTMDGDVDGD